MNVVALETTDIKFGFRKSFAYRDRNIQRNVLQKPKTNPGTLINVMSVVLSVQDSC